MNQRLQLHNAAYISCGNPQFLHVMLRARTLVQRIHLNSPFFDYRSYLPDSLLLLTSSIYPDFQ